MTFELLASKGQLNLLIAGYNAKAKRSSESTLIFEVGGKRALGGLYGALSVTFESTTSNGE